MLSSEPGCRGFESRLPLHLQRYSESPVWRCNVGAVNGCDRLRAAVPHDQLQLTLKNFEHAIDTRLPERSQPPQERASDSYRLSSQRQCLEDVGAPPNSPVNEHRNPIADFVDDFGKSLDGRSSCFGGSASVIRNQNAVQAMFDAEARVLPRINALDKKLHRCCFPQPVDKFPGHGRV